MVFIMDPDYRIPPDAKAFLNSLPTREVSKSWDNYPDFSIREALQPENPMPKKKTAKRPFTTQANPKQKFADRLLANREARVARRKSLLAGLKKAGGLLWEHRKEILDLIERLAPGLNPL